MDNDQIPVSKFETHRIDTIPNNTLANQNSDRKMDEENQNSDPKINEENQINVEKTSEENEKKREYTDNNIPGATFVLLNTCLGTSIFTFGIRCSQFGFFWFMLFNLVGGVVNVWSMIRMIQAVENLKERDYSQIVRKVLGKVCYVLLNISLLLCTFLLITTYISLIHQLVGRFILSIWYKDDYADYNEFKDKMWWEPKLRFPIIFGYTIVLCCICIIRDLSKLNFAGYFGVFAITYSILVVLVEANKYYNFYKDNIYVKEEESTHPNWWDFRKAFTKELNFFRGMASLFTAYGGHTSVYPLYETFTYVKDGTNKMKKSIIYCNIITCAYHFLCIVPAFLTNPVQQADLIIFRKNEFGGYDIPMNIAKFTVAICLFFSVPLLYVAYRKCLVVSFLGGKLITPVNLGVTIGTFLVSTILATLYDKILNYINYIGGFLIGLYCYLFPILLYIYSNKKGFTYWKNILELTGAIILYVIGLIAGILTIIDDIKELVN